MQNDLNLHTWYGDMDVGLENDEHDESKDLPARNSHVSSLWMGFTHRNLPPHYPGYRSSPGIYNHPPEASSFSFSK